MKVKLNFNKFVFLFIILMLVFSGCSEFMGKSLEALPGFTPAEQPSQQTGPTIEPAEPSIESTPQPLETTTTQIVETNEDTPVTFDLKIAPINTPVYCTISQKPWKGIASIEKNSCKATYSPSLNLNGRDSFTYNVIQIQTGSNGTGTSNPLPGNTATTDPTVEQDEWISGKGKAIIKIKPVNDAPTMNDIPDQCVVKENYLNFTISATDVDDPGLTFSADGLPSWLKITGMSIPESKNAIVSGTAPNETSTSPVAFIATDSSGEKDDANMIIYVKDECMTFCGDGTCNPEETCSSCPTDCGACYCGNGSCDPEETSTSCPADCGSGGGSEGGGSSAGGGGGGGGRPRACTAEDIVYSEWSSCIDGTQTRNYSLKSRCSGDINAFLELLEQECEEEKECVGEECGEAALEGTCSASSKDGTICYENGKTGKCINGKCVIVKAETSETEEPEEEKAEEGMNPAIIPLVAITLVLIAATIYFLVKKKKEGEAEEEKKPPWEKDE